MMARYLGVASFSHPLDHLEEARLQSQAHTVLCLEGDQFSFPGEHGHPDLQVNREHGGFIFD